MQLQLVKNGKEVVKLYVFNPDSDLALANNSENYLAPAAVSQMARDLALLPIWYANPDSGVLAPSAYNAPYLKQMKELLGVFVALVTEPELPQLVDVEVMPWGWNLAFRKRMFRGGIDEGALPTMERLQALRALSSRQSGLAVLGAFKQEADCCGEAFCLSSLSACQAFVEGASATVLKMPWSGSGRGLNWCRGLFTDSLAGWCKHVLNEQGCILGEPMYNKVEDLALEFYSDGCGTLSFVGYSLFLTNAKGAYAGNRLVADKEVEQWVSGYLPPELLPRVRARLQKELQTLYASAYTGYLGVDMMICRDETGQRYRLHPCVEVNMRTNMGVVAHLLRQRWVALGRSGRFMLTSHSTAEALQAAHREMSDHFPLVVEGGRIVSGYLPLVPVTAKGLFLAYIVVD